MKIILKEDVKKLGSVGDLVTVKDGYGRNYLIPKKKAVLATKSALNELELMKLRAAHQAELTVQEAKELAQKIESTSLTVSVKTGENNKIFGTVTNIQIASALAEKGIQVDRKNISIDNDVKLLGEYTATVNILGDLKPKAKFWVVKAD